MAACAGMAWWVVRNIDGDGLSEIDDPRPARAVVRVTDDAGVPLAGATVDAYLEPPLRWNPEDAFDFDPSSEPEAVFTQTTDASGVATLAGLGSGVWQVGARIPGRATAFARVQGGHAALHEVRLALGVARTVHGRVTDGDGHAVPQAIVLSGEVSGRPFDATQWIASVRARCGPQGEFELGGLPAAIQALWVARPGEAPVAVARVLVPACAAIDLSIPAQGRPAVVRKPASGISPAPAGAAAVRGRVVSPEGAPLAGAFVTALHHGPYRAEETLTWTCSGPDGEFALAGIPADTEIALRIATWSHFAITTPWRPASEFPAATTYRLEDGARIECHVRTPDGAPLRDPRVWIYRLGDSEKIAFNGLTVLWAGSPMWPTRAPPASPREPGRFDATWIYDRARLLAYVTAEGFAPTVSAPFDLAAGTDPARIEVVLDPGVTLRGQLLAPDGSVLAKRPVRIRPPQFDRRWNVASAVTDAEGRFEIAHVPVRPVVVEAGGEGSGGWNGATVTPAEAEIRIRLRKRPPGKRAPASDD